MAAAVAAPERFGMATGSYEAERDDWRAAVERAAAEGFSSIELTAIREKLLATLDDFLYSPHAALLAVFTRVSVHAPVRFESTRGDVVAQVARHAYDVILHPDVYAGEPAVAALGGQAVFENMDPAKAFGRTSEDLRATFERFPEAGFCLDVAHVWANDPTLELGFRLLDEHGDRLRQCHVSGIERDGTHRPLTDRDLEAYEPLLARCPDVPLLLESVVAGAAAA